ncbi:hypothetical protein [Saccharomonospora iraqiensis]|uniref:hypothetical protein n=1 Tax=Saccharomonospora iraqiensis TaxID=52698 RepID=UPI00047BADB2|nr:hypothetical protein [Saccharomonospora iraqiensis]
MSRTNRSTQAFVIAAAIFTISGCSSGTADTSKRIPAGEPCDLLTPHEAADILETNRDDILVEPSDGFQCDYRSESLFSGANVVRGQDMSKMSTDEQVDIGEIHGTRLDVGADTSCGVHVVLDDEDSTQRFSTIATGAPSTMQKTACEISDAFAAAILDNLPG